MRITALHVTQKQTKRSRRACICTAGALQDPGELKHQNPLPYQFITCEPLPPANYIPLYHPETGVHTLGSITYSCAPFRLYQIQVCTL